jgi:hypothetical protein
MDCDASHDLSAFCFSLMGSQWHDSQKPGYTPSMIIAKGNDMIAFGMYMIDGDYS